MGSQGGGTAQPSGRSVVTHQNDASRRSRCTAGRPPPRHAMSSATARPAAATEAGARSLTAKAAGRSQSSEKATDESHSASPPRYVHMSRGNPYSGSVRVTFGDEVSGIAWAPCKRLSAHAMSQESSILINLINVYPAHTIIRNFFG